MAGRRIARLVSLVLPRGKHRASRVEADLAPIAALLAAGQLDNNDTAWCDTCPGRRVHAFHPDGSRTCWTCTTTTEAE
ncbi:hypothetical protein [Streptomyces sp. NPDC002994]|uniref:hypothetical protein n=1 Tax=Streptomyces sp. NPDC002994 TaxID=3154441 RepID=UPI00339E128C